MYILLITCVVIILIISFIGGFLGGMFNSWIEHNIRKEKSKIDKGRSKHGK